MSWRRWDSFVGNGWKSIGGNQEYILSIEKLGDTKQKYAKDRKKRKLVPINTKKEEEHLRDVRGVIMRDA